MHPSPDAVPSNLPLAHRTILVTRAAGQSSQFSTLLTNQGASVLEMPAIAIGPPASWQPLDEAIAQIDQFDWLILTSANGVTYTFDRLQHQGVALPSSLKLAVVGQKTSKSLQSLGYKPDFIPPNFVADSLIEHFPEPVSGLRLLFPRVESGGREVLMRELTEQGAIVTEVPAYESGCETAIAPEIQTALVQKQIDVITFASSKTVKCVAQLLQSLPDAEQLIQSVSIASIGPQTSIACQTYFGRVDMEATEYTLDGLTEAIAQWASRSQSV